MTHARESRGPWQIEWQASPGNMTELTFALETPRDDIDYQDGKVRLSGYAITEGPPAILSVTGADGQTLYRGPADLPRRDALRGVIQNWTRWDRYQGCGYDMLLPLSTFPVRLHIQTAHHVGPVLTIAANGPPHPALGESAEGTPFAFFGRDGQLFLAGDSNDSVGQFTGQISLSESSLSAWKQSLDRLPEFEVRFGTRLAFVVALAKEEVFFDHYPFPRSDRCPLERFMAQCRTGHVVPLKWALRNTRQFSYRKSDTHWSDFGATMAAREVLMHWGFDAPILGSLPQAFRVVQKIGDLGNKLERREASRDLFFMEDLTARLVFDNGIRNSGNIRVFENRDAPLQQTCLVLGDSFGTNFAEALTGAFARVVYAYLPATFDETLARLVRPDYTILEITQRFLVGQPDHSKSIFDVVLNKLSKMDPVQRNQTLEMYRTFLSTPFSTFVEPVLGQV